MIILGVFILNYPLVCGMSYSMGFLNSYTFYYHYIERKIWLDKYLLNHIIFSIKISQHLSFIFWLLLQRKALGCTRFFLYGYTFHSYFLLYRILYPWKKLFIFKKNHKDVIRCNTYSIIVTWSLVLYRWMYVSAL